VNTTQLPVILRLARLSAAALAIAILSWLPTAAHANTTCADVARMEIPGATISEATAVPANQPFAYSSGFGPPIKLNSLPAHCIVHGEVNHHKGADGKDYGDKFELRLPEAWKGRLLFEGGGGLDGVIRPALGLQGPYTSPHQETALNQGYAVVSDDGGHQDPNPMAMDGSFGLDPGARADYDYLSTKLVADVARQIIARFYGTTVQHAYFRGCSNGGREGMKTAEMYPDYFDGVIAGAPAFNLTHAAIAEAWNTQQLASIAPRLPNGMPDLSQSLTEGDLKLLAGAVLEKCDALDGLKDGMIFNPEACHFDPAVLQCSAGKTTGCLPPEKVEVIHKIFDGPHDSSGKPIYSRWPYDAGVAAEGWRVWMTGAGPMPPINVLVFPAFFNGVALAGAQPPIDIFTFNFDKDPARVDKTSEEINATSSDWSGFRKHHGKLLLYTGMSDPVFSPLDLIRYYHQIEPGNGSDFARLFLVPGMNHCVGGPGLDDFDTLGTMERWVEKDVAPDTILASGQAFPGRTRPLCAYPKSAKYRGVGNTENAASFSCEQMQSGGDSIKHNK
jgi:pimeloyl-ACP methyl ester carboxylesterase